MRIRARHYATGELVEITCDRDRIVSIGSPSALPPDREAGWVAPALFDLQVNGCHGHNFSSDQLTVEAVHHVVAVFRQHGIRGFCPPPRATDLSPPAPALSTAPRRARDPPPRA